MPAGCRSLRVVTAPLHPALGRHFDAWLGGRPAADGTIRVVGSARRDQPGWDGRIHPLVGVVTPDGGLVSVPPAYVDAVGEALAGHGPDSVRRGGPWSAAVAAAMGRSEARVINGVFRWTAEPASHPDAGVWVPVDDPVVPRWLKPFGGEVLLALDEGRYVAGVGLKRHDPTGQEIAVVTEEPARGRGLARRLVSQAARRVVGSGAVVTYLHAPDNTASARVAEASEFPDEGWRVLALAPV